MSPTFYLRLEGLVLLALSVMLYYYVADSWWLFVLLILAPDVSMAGYGFNKVAGAFVYNLGHSLVIPLLLLGIGYLYEQDLLLSIGLIWVAHIGLDRALGFGLKETKGFKYTNLGRIGK